MDSRLLLASALALGAVALAIKQTQSDDALQQAVQEFTGMATQISQYGKNFIETWEGRRLKPYKDTAGLWTIGIGHLLGATLPSGYAQGITNEQCDTLFAQDLQAPAKAIATHVKVPLTQGQYDALTSILFNLGPGVPGKKDGIIYLKSGANSTLLRKLNAGDYAGARSEFLKWVNSGGKVTQGLVNRRNAEVSQLWDK